MSRRKSTYAENNNFVERLVEVCGTSKPAEISRMLDVSYQAAKNYLQGRLPDSNVLLTISKRTDYSIHWLVTGEGKKFVQTDQEKDREILTDEIRAFVRREFMNLINEILVKQAEQVDPKIVVLSSDKIKEEKVLDDSIPFPVNNRR
jgi:predicted transcriptional regulator